MGNTSGHGRPNLSSLYFYFLKLGTFGFGGGAVLVESMERHLVHEQKIITHEQFKEGLAFSQLSPGPLAPQLAMYVGLLLGGIEGATLVSFAFLLPSFLMVLALSYLYVSYGGLPWLQPVFYFVGAVVVAIIAKSSYRLLTRTMKNGAHWAIAIALALTTFILQWANLWLFLAAGIVMVLLPSPTAIPSSTPAQTLPAEQPKKGEPKFPPIAAALPLGALSAIAASQLMTLFFYFLQAGITVFGAGLAILPSLYGGMVTQTHWLTDRQFLDAVSISMITPGPVVITAAFMGYIVAGPAGAIVASLGIFLPVYVITLTLAPFYQRLAAISPIKAFIGGVTAAALGALAGGVALIALKSVIDLPTLVVFLAALVVCVKTKIPEPVLISAGALLGLGFFFIH